MQINYYSMSPYDEDRANEKIVEIARKYGLNPGMLRDILLLRNRGMNNGQIADQMGINRNTVNKYVNALNEMNQNDLLQSSCVSCNYWGWGSYYQRSFKITFWRYRR